MTTPSPQQEDFMGRLQAARVGDRIPYHLGYLGRDRILGLTYSATDKLAKVVWSAYEKGLVYLVQRRIGPKIDGVCQYIAIKRDWKLTQLPTKPVYRRFGK